MGAGSRLRLRPVRAMALLWAEAPCASAADGFREHPPGPREAVRAVACQARPPVHDLARLQASEALGAVGVWARAPAWGQGVPSSSPRAYAQLPLRCPLHL
eukprot:scaffold28462_cov25-Tisochrysis_lutea.AAC.2